MNAYREFWDVPMEWAPAKTGAEGQMDCSDLLEVLVERFGLDLHNSAVADVGCGTGRLEQFCGAYKGYDVAPGMVEYAKGLGVEAELIDGPDDLTAKVDLVCCMSVFTHIPRDERVRYLRKFSEMCSWLVVDILPGEEGGSIAATYADTSLFESDLRDSGFVARDSHERVSADGATHLYYLSEAK